MPIYETPWGPKTVTTVDESVNKIVLEMWADHDERMSEIGYYCNDLIKEHENSSMSTLDLVEWFLAEDDKTYKQMVRLAKSAIKEQKADMKEYVRLGVEIEEECRKMRGATLEQRKDRQEFLVALRVTPYIEKLEERIKKNEQILMLVGKTPEGVPTYEGLDFERAKLVPIIDLIPFKAGFAPCVWHSEKSPSMKYYQKNNRVHCFGCGKGGDAIDVIQAIKDCDVATAVKFLTNA